MNSMFGINIFARNIAPFQGLYESFTFITKDFVVQHPLLIHIK